MNIIIISVSLLLLSLTSDGASSGSWDYKTALKDSILFYEAQRTGKLPSTNRISFRGDSMLQDKGQNGEDLTGGYFDAGDWVKFGFPAAYALTMLSYGGIKYADAYTTAGETANLLASVKWGTDFILKCHVSDGSFYGQVGNGGTDHSIWGRPEEWNYSANSRPAYKLQYSSDHGSDLLGETAAALAAASILFKSSDATYSNTLLSHSKTLYAWAKTNLGTYTDAISDAKSYYPSSGFGDELSWAAAWLYKATGTASYLTDADNFYNQYGLKSGTALSWDSKHVAVQLLLAETTGNSKYITDLKNWADFMVSGQKKTPKGLLFIQDWGSLGAATSQAFVLFGAAELSGANSAGINTENYYATAIKQVTYALGDSGRSFLTGFGTNPPTHYHHKAASCPNKPAACDWNTYNSANSNAQTMLGALVGGPDANDSYNDVRSDYAHNEVALNYNAGFQGSLAAIIHLKSAGKIQ